MNVKQLSILVLGFVLSVALRWPGLDTQYKGYHYWLNLHVLTTAQIWDETGFSTYHGNLVLTFPGEQNRFIGIAEFSHFYDEHGHTYYTSYPPLGIWIPYGLHRVLGLSISAFSLKVWGMGLHLLCILVLFAALRFLPIKDDYALFLTLLYLFAPGPMYYQANIYFSEMLAQLWWLLCLWGYGWSRTLPPKRLHFSFWLGLSFVFVFTEWLGVLAIGSLGIIWLWEKRPIKALFPLIIGGSLAIALTLWQYGQIAGIEALLRQWTQRYAYRSGNFLTAPVFLEEVILKHPHRMFALLPTVGVLGVLYRLFRRELKPPDKIVYLALLPYLLHTLLFQEYSHGHDFSALKSGPFWIFLVVWTIPNVPRPGIKGKSLLVLFTLAWISLGIQRYYLYNSASTAESSIGRSIKAQAPAGKPVFIENQMSKLPINYTAQRNVGEADSLAVQRWLAETGHWEAVLFHIVDDSVQSMQHIYAPIKE